MDRDKHFAWESTVEALCGLCPSSAIAILSRLRDRGFGWNERILPVAITELIEREELDPRDALPLIGFRAQWDFSAVLEKALAVVTGPEERASVGRFLYRYAQFSVASSSDLQALKSVAEKHGLLLDGLAKQIASAERTEARARSESPQYDEVFPSSESRASAPWDDIFAGVNVAEPQSLSLAYLKFKGT